MRPASRAAGPAVIASIDGFLGLEGQTRASHADGLALAGIAAWLHP